MTQPWATLVAIGANVIETRDWPTKYRGPFVIHAAKGFPPDAQALCRKQPFRDALAVGGYASADDLPRGSVVALVKLESLLVCGPSTLKEIRSRSKRGELLPTNLTSATSRMGATALSSTTSAALIRPYRRAGCLDSGKHRLMSRDW